MSGEITHYGVKGMKWGVRKEKPKISRKENRRLNKEARMEFRVKKAEYLYKHAKTRGEKTLILVALQNNISTIVNGKQFADHLERGGSFDVRMSEVFADKKGKGEFEKNTNYIGDYKKQNFRRTS